MKIKRIKIQNFRCLEEVDVDFDSITTFIGPNGSGKSSILRALDWFFNGDQATVLGDDDVFSGAEENNRKIRVEVAFDSLTSEDREQLGKYAPSVVETVSIWRTWENGQDKITGKALAYPAFETVRVISGANDKRAAYNNIRTEHSELSLPAASSAQQVEDAMLAWERSNPTQLVEAEVPGTNFFGWAGQGKMSGLFDFVLVTADLRAEEETTDNKTAILGKILERTLDRTSADQELATLAASIKTQQNEIYSRNFGEQLEVISNTLTDAVSAFTSGRKIKVAAQEVDLKPTKAQFQVSVLDSLIETKVSRQGHGFQRALLITALKLLAEQNTTTEAAGTVCLAIEEPELFQHPTQAQAFASVLRKLAEDSDQNMQVMYATHSPYFIEATHFDQIKRLHRIQSEGQHPNVIVRDATVAKVIAQLNGFVSEATVRKQIDGVCLNTLPVGLFAEKVVLTEGTTDCAVIEGVSERGEDASLSVNGISMVSVGSKTSILLPCAILDLLEIPKYVIFDGDNGYEARANANNVEQSTITSTVANNKKHNQLITKYLGENPPIDWPDTQSGNTFASFKDSLEQCLRDWEGWQDHRNGLLGPENGFEGKNAATYKRTSQSCPSEPPEILKNIIEKIRSA